MIDQLEPKEATDLYIQFIDSALEAIAHLTDPAWEACRDNARRLKDHMVAARDSL